MLELAHLEFWQNTDGLTCPWVEHSLETHLLNNGSIFIIIITIVNRLSRIGSWR